MDKYVIHIYWKKEQNHVADIIFPFGVTLADHQVTTCPCMNDENNSLVPIIGGLDYICNFVRDLRQRKDILVVTLYQVTDFSESNNVRKLEYISVK